MPNGGGWYSVRYGVCAVCGTKATPAYDADLAEATLLRLCAGAHKSAIDDPNDDGELILPSHRNGASVTNLKQAPLHTTENAAQSATAHENGVSAPATFLRALHTLETLPPWDMHKLHYSAPMNPLAILRPRTLKIMQTRVLPRACRRPTRPRWALKLCKLLMSLVVGLARLCKSAHVPCQRKM